VETVLSEIQADGYNTLRVWLNFCCSGGGGFPEAREVSRSGRSGHRRLDSGDRRLQRSGDAGCKDHGLERLFPDGWRRQRYAKYWSDIVNGLAALNAPFDAILAWEVQNELYFDSTSPTLSLTSGTLTTGDGGLCGRAQRGIEQPCLHNADPGAKRCPANTWLNGGGLIDTDPQITSQGGTVYLMAEAGGNTIYLLTFAEASQTFGTWNFTNGVLNDATIAAAAGNVYVAGRDSADRIYWYSATGSSWFFAGGAGISSTVLTGGK
jgi:hypothetical protein